MALHALAQRLAVRTWALVTSKSSLLSGPLTPSTEHVSANFNARLILDYARQFVGRKAVEQTSSIARVANPAKTLRQVADKSWKSAFPSPVLKPVPWVAVASLMAWLFPSTMQDIYYLDGGSTLAHLFLDTACPGHNLQDGQSIHFMTHFLSRIKLLTLLSPFLLFLVPRGDQLDGDEVAWLENTLVAAVLRLPDNEWPQNWDFLSQSLLRVAFKRAVIDDPKNGSLTSTYILEQLLEKRKLLPPEQSISSTILVICNELYPRYYFTRDFNKGMNVSKILYHELEKLETGNIPEQKSLALFQMAACCNMKGDAKLAEEYLRAAFSFLKFEKLPPHRFKEHLLRLIALSYHHQLIEVPPTDAFKFLVFARKFYKELDSKMKNFSSDNPWNRIIDDIEAQGKAQFDESKELAQVEHSVESATQEEQMAKLLAINEWINDIAKNPKYSTREKVAALRTLILQFNLSEKEQNNLKIFIRKFRASAAIPDNFEPNPKKSVPPHLS